MRCPRYVWLIVLWMLVVAPIPAPTESAENIRQRRSDRPRESSQRLSARSIAAAQSVPPAPTRLPELPRISIDTTYVPNAGRTIPVPAGGNFQAALNTAQPGDTIVLQAGQTYTGPFTLPSKPGSLPAGGQAGGWILIQSSAHASLPPPGTRVGPGDAPKMPKIVSAIGPYAIRTTSGAHHYRFVGIELAPAPRTYLTAVAAIGEAEASVNLQPHHVIFDRCYIHGDPVKGSRRGIIFNGVHLAVIDSYLSGFKDVFDSQAVAGWNGPGPFKIVNNYLEASAENVAFGGALPTVPNLIPSDIEIRRNHFSKPLSWKIGHPTYAGTAWMVKNLLELKSGNRVVIEGNVMEYAWAHAQPGAAIVLTPRADSGTWATVSDITITNNLIRHTGSGMAVSGFEAGFGLKNHSRNVLIRNNLLADVGGQWSGEGHLLQVVNGIQSVTIDHNTGIQTGSIITGEPADPNPGFVFRNNIVPNGPYGVIAGAVGSLALNKVFPGAVFEKNIIAGPWPTPGGATPAHYSGHPNNFFPNSINEVGFADASKGNYRLAQNSRYRKAATDGKDIGVDMDALEAATAGVVVKRAAE